MNKIDLGFMLGMCFTLLCDILCEPIRRNWRKKCNFNCSKCKVFDCDYWVCKRQKEKKNVSRKT